MKNISGTILNGLVMLLPSAFTAHTDSIREKNVRLADEMPATASDVDTEATARVQACGKKIRNGCDWMERTKPRFFEWAASVGSVLFMLSFLLIEISKFVSLVLTVLRSVITEISEFIASLLRLLQ